MVELTKSIWKSSIDTFVLFGNCLSQFLHFTNGKKHKRCLYTSTHFKSHICMMNFYLYDVTGRLQTFCNITCHNIGFLHLQTHMVAVVLYLFTADINECDPEEDLDECEQICMNTVGSYTCDCNSGYILREPDRRNCLGE